MDPLIGVKVFKPTKSISKITYKLFDNLFTHTHTPSLEV